MYKVLLVEDELVLRETLGEILELSDFEVVAVDSGENALKVLSSWQPDMIVSDILMPGMNGFELIQAVKKIAASAKIPFIFLSALTSESDRKLARDFGAVDFMMKPFKSREVVSTILKYVRN